MNLTSDELVAIHAEQRAKERYGIDLSDADRADMVDQVKNGRGLFFKKKTGSAKVSIWLVWWAGASRIVPIYYKSGRVLTVLPPDAFFCPGSREAADDPQDCDAVEPAGAANVAGIENALADLIVAYYEREIGRLMQQAEHWAANGAPVAVMHRLHTADAYFQIVCQFRRGLKRLEINPFDEIRKALARPKLMPLGTYPPSPELHRYRDPEFVAAALAFMEGSPDD